MSEARSAATGGTGFQVPVVEPVETRLRALRASAGSITTQLSRSRMIGVVAAASDAISASVSGLVPSASRQSNANIASGPNRPVISGLSPRTWSTSARGSSWACSPRGQKTSTPIASRAPTPCSRRSASSSPVSTMRSGTGSRSSRSSVGQATAARRSSVPALSRARREKPWPDPSHSVGRVGDVAGVVAVVHLQHDREQAVGELLGGGLDPQADHHVGGQVGVVVGVHERDRSALRLRLAAGSGSSCRPRRRSGPGSGPRPPPRRPRRTHAPAPAGVRRRCRRW